MRDIVDPKQPRALLIKLVVAELLARPGEGPLAPRFARPRHRARAPESTPSKQPRAEEEP